MRQPLLLVLRLWTITAFAIGLMAQDVSKLPSWARPHAEAALREIPPSEADVWVILDRTEVAYVGEGVIRTRRLRLVRILNESGIGERLFLLHGLGGNATKIKQMKAWNLRPDGELATLDRKKDAITLSNVGEADVSSDTLTLAEVPRVVKGSWVAYESMQVIQHPLGGIASVPLMEPFPVRRWELEVAKQEGWFTNLKKVDIKIDSRHFYPWIKDAEIRTGQGISVSRLPRLPKAKDEAFTPDAHNALPWVSVRFIDPDLVVAPSWVTWEAHASWIYAKYQEQMIPGPLPVLKGMDPKQALQSLSAWMAKELHYKQVYLTPERGWIPLSAVEVGRRQYGDCKDLSTFFLAHAQRLGFRAFPVLARIVEGEIEEAEPPSPVFNHVIAALRLERSLGYASEVETAEGRFLLFDPTDRFTPFGTLGSSHQGRRVLICTDRSGVWARIPDSAIGPSKVEVHWKGEVSSLGRMKGNLKISEVGSGWRLRETAQSSGTANLKTFLQKEVLDLPPTGQFSIVQQSDPLDLSRSYELEIEFNHPEAMRASGAEADLVPLGLKITLPMAQRAGVPRQLPLAYKAGPELLFEADLRLPGAYSPVLPSLEDETAFRRFTWSARSSPEESGTRLRLHLHHRWKNVLFDFDQREAGVTAAKKDRTLARSLLEDGMRVKLVP